jgi:hypothetical protein
VLSGMASALHYQGPARERPDLRGRLGQERARECRAARGACLPAAGSGPRALNASEIAALADLPAKGWRVTVDAAGALCLPGETLHIVIRPRPVFGGRREESGEP